MMIIKFVSVVILILLNSGATAQTGSLDNAFGNSGKVITDFGNTSSSFGSAIAIQIDGKIVVAGKNSIAGKTSCAIVQYNINGTLDNSFDTDGIVITNFSNTTADFSIVIQNDGKIVVAGTKVFNAGEGIVAFGVTRYNINGSLDIGFGNNGETILGGGYCNSIALQSDGKILIAGSTSGYALDFSVVRLNSNGTPDTNFGIWGSGAAQFNVGPGGTYPAFNYGGSVLVQNDGKILVAGTCKYSKDASPRRPVIFRLNSNGGTFDPSFGNGGVSYGDIIDPNMNLGSYNDNIWCAALQSDGKILIAGSANTSWNNGDFSVLRLNNNGTLDYSFGINGSTIINIGTGIEEVRSIAIQSDGKIILAGSSIGTGIDFALVRLNKNGTLDKTFNGDGKITTNIGSGDDFGCSVVIQSDGKVIVAGRTMNGAKGNFALVRYQGTKNLVLVQMKNKEVYLFTPIQPKVFSAFKTNQILQSIKLEFMI